MTDKERLFIPTEKFKSFSGEAESAIRFGYQLTEGWRYWSVGSLHLLFGVLREGSGAYPLEEMGVDTRSLLGEIRDMQVQSERGVGLRPAPREINVSSIWDDLTGGGREVVGYANMLATAAGLERILPESLLIGVVWNETGSGAHLLRQKGITKEKLLQGY